MEQQKPKRYATLRVGWAEECGRAPWTADVVEGERGFGIEHQHVGVCEYDWCSLSAGWTPLPNCTPGLAIAYVQDARDILIRERLPIEGEPVLSDVLIDTLGNSDHVDALAGACLPVWTKVARGKVAAPAAASPGRVALILAAIAGLMAATTAAWWFFLRAP